MLTFDPAKHEYRWDGKPVVNVTRVLDEISDLRFVKPDVLKRARDLGTAVHKTVAMFEAGRLDETRTPQLLLAYLTQWREFKSDMQYVPMSMGRKLYSSEFKYAGEFDTYGSFHKNPEVTIIDLKTGEPYPWHKLQTAGYKQMLVEEENDDLHSRRMWMRGSLYLSEDSYRFEWHKDDRNDRAAFLGLLTYYKWKQHNG